MQIIINKSSIAYIVIPYVLLTFFGCIKTEVDNDIDDITGEPCRDMPTFSDQRDNNLYNTVQIGDQCWLKENLKYLPSVSPSNTTSRSSKHYYVYGYEGTSVSEAIATNNYNNYGVLYNWSAAQDACPPGWRVANDNDWKQLEAFLGMDESDIENQAYRGINQGNILKSRRQINSPLGGAWSTAEHPRWNEHESQYGSDDFGFSGLPGGHLYSKGFERLGQQATWWSISGGSIGIDICRSLRFNEGGIGRGYGEKESAYSIRCIRVK